MIRLTYVTITYNAASVLRRTLDSVLSQDYPEIVHLIIDGASTDATLQLVDDYIERSNATGTHHRIQVTSEPDKGIYDAMNKGSPGYGQQDCREGGAAGFVACRALR